MSGFERFLRLTAALPAAFGCTHFHCNFINARSLRIREQLTEARRTLQRCAAPAGPTGNDGGCVIDRTGSSWYTGSQAKLS
jgi:hypothetical protein